MGHRSLHYQAEILMVPSELNFDPKNLPILKYIEVSSNGIVVTLWAIKRPSLRPAFVLRKHFCS